jgi:hypothetical protein
MREREDSISERAMPAVYKGFKWYQAPGKRHGREKDVIFAENEKPLGQWLF